MEPAPNGENAIRMSSEKPADINTEAGELETAPEGGICTKLETAEPGASRPAESLPSGDPAAVPVELWVPVEVGGGDIVMPCRSVRHRQCTSDGSGRRAATLCGDVAERLGAGLPKSRDLSNSWTGAPRLTY